MTSFDRITAAIPAPLRALVASHDQSVKDAADAAAIAPRAALATLDRDPPAIRKAHAEWMKAKMQTARAVAELAAARAAEANAQSVWSDRVTVLSREVEALRRAATPPYRLSAAITRIQDELTLVRADSLTLTMPSILDVLQAALRTLMNVRDCAIDPLPDLDAFVQAALDASAAARAVAMREDRTRRAAAESEARKRRILT